MEKFSIETRDGDEYIVSNENGFTLKVIPPGKQESHIYTPRKEVAAIYLEEIDLAWPDCSDFKDDDEYEEALHSRRSKFRLDHYEFE